MCQVFHQATFRTEAGNIWPVSGIAGSRPQGFVCAYAHAQAVQQGAVPMPLPLLPPQGCSVSTTSGWSKAVERSENSMGKAFNSLALPSSLLGRSCACTAVKEWGHGGWEKQWQCQHNLQPPSRVDLCHGQGTGNWFHTYSLAQIQLPYSWKLHLHHSCGGAGWGERGLGEAEVVGAWLLAAWLWWGCRERPHHPLFMFCQNHLAQVRPQLGCPSFTEKKVARL